MKIFNSKSNKVETFVPIEPGKVSFYLCGPTVYNHAHIGNARPIVVFDLLRRVLKASGYEVKYVSNYTDIDDRIIQKALDEMVSESEIAQRYIDAYEWVRDNLHAGHVDETPRVTQVIDDIIEFITALMDKGYAYAVDGDVYFRVDRVKSYGSISHQKLDELRVGARIDENEAKENALDFVLWKNTDDEGIKWDSPWGMGRPGWHTECVVMIHDSFGGSIDIHAGGQDLRFPHHENESAQNYAIHNHDLANYWLHNAMLQIDGEKMSKSLGNVIWAKDYIEKFGSNVTRWLLLSTHYRLVLNISDDTISQAQKSIQRIGDAYKKATLTLSLNNIKQTNNYDVDLYQSFLEPLQNDLNVANAQVALFECIKKINQSLRTKDYDFEAIDLYVNTIEKMLDILGLTFEAVNLSDADKTLFNNWENAKAIKDFEQADIYRQRLLEKGYL